MKPRWPSFLELEELLDDAGKRGYEDCQQIRNFQTTKAADTRKLTKAVV